MNPGDQRTTPESWQDRIQNAVGRAEQELQTVIAYLNDEVVPEVRRNSSEALRKAAEELHQLAERMANHRADGPAGKNPKP